MASTVTTDPVLDDLLAFVGESPTPFHAVSSASARLASAGFRPLAEGDDWSSLAPGRYAFAHGGSSMLAEDARLPDRLISADITQLRRPIRGEQQHRDTREIRFDDGGVQIHRSCA